MCWKLRLQRTKGTSRRAGIQKHAAVVLVGFGYVCVTGNEDINVQLSTQDGKAFFVAPRNNLMSMSQTDLKATHSQYFSLGKW